MVIFTGGSRPLHKAGKIFKRFTMRTPWGTDDQEMF